MSAPIIPTLSPATIVFRPSWFATENFIQMQRIIGVALIAFGALATLLSPLTFGISRLLNPFGIMGGVLIGASLLQQVVGESPDCERGKGKRAVAGLCLMLGGPILGWAVGGLFWYLSALDNKRE